MASSLQIDIPRQFNVNNFSKLFQKTVGPDREPLITNVTVDFSQLHFIEPTGVTVLSNFLEWLKQKSIPFSLQGFENYQDAIAYLDDSGFFKHYCNDYLRASRHLRTTTKTLEFIATDNSLFWLRQNLISWITENSGREEAAFRELLMCLQEVFLNIRDHSGTKIGSVFAQFFPRDNRLAISVSDIGVGIPSNVRKYLDKPNLSDSDAIIKACEYGFTTSSHPGNAGRGLGDLVRATTDYYKGSLIVISDSGYVKYEGENERIADHRNRDWIYPGSLIDISIRTDMIPESEEEDFEW